MGNTSKPNLGSVISSELSDDLKLLATMAHWVAKDPKLVRKYLAWVEEQKGEERPEWYTEDFASVIMLQSAHRAVQLAGSFETVSEMFGELGG